MKQSIVDRFLDKVSPEPMSGCWLWTAASDRVGYGVFRHDNKMHKAHRVAYRLFRGSVPDGLQLDHKCRVRCCVNPDHLEPVTPSENKRRGLQGILRTHCAQGHALTEENTGRSKAKDGTNNHDQVWCRICKRQRFRAWERKRKVIHAQDA